MLQQDIQHFVTRLGCPPGLCRCALLLVSCPESAQLRPVHDQEFSLQLRTTNLESALPATVCLPEKPDGKPTCNRG